MTFNIECPAYSLIISKQRLFLLISLIRDCELCLFIQWWLKANVIDLCSFFLNICSFLFAFYFLFKIILFLFWKKKIYVLTNFSFFNWHWLITIIQ